jgi:calcineurin-like phosphoesterase family protein
MKNVFFIADLHLGHRATATWRTTPTGAPFTSGSEHDEYLIAEWNTKITTKDTIYILGDVVWNKRSLPLVDRLHGTKKLVLGNHDTLASATYLQHFTKLYGAIGFDGNILTHIPVHEEHVRPRYRFNIHGHIHANPPVSDAHRCVCIEHIGFTPIAYEELIHADEP